jgi:transposase
VSGRPTNVRGSVLVMDQQAWNAAHVAAFEFFDGVPARIVPDNLKTGVTKPDFYDPMINRAYAELGAHYGVLIEPARASKPKDKPRVERPMPYVRDSFWRGREFTSLEQMQAEAARWWVRSLAAGPCRPTGRGDTGEGVRRDRGPRARGAAGAGP